MNRTYPVVIEKGDGVFGAFFPDLPGCVGAGDSVEEAFEDAQAALALHLAGMVEDGDPLPDATPLADVALNDPEVTVVSVLLASAPVTGKTTRINITMDSTLLAAIDTVTTNRSAWLADAALQALRASRR